MRPESRAGRLIDWLQRTGPVKVPQITVLFWLVKVVSTGMGEAASDYLASVSLVIGAVVGLGGVVLALVLQLRAGAFSLWRYWFAVSMVAVFGTMAADVLHKVLLLPYPVTTAFWAAVVALVFVVWRRAEGTLSIHSIVSHRREAFYWAAVVATFALGTAAGDLTAVSWGLGYFPSAVLFAAAIAVPLIGWRLGLHPVATFWTAYVLTRPLGASVADWLGKPAGLGGLGWGDGVVAAGAVVLIIVLVGAVAARDRGRVRRPGPEVATEQSWADSSTE